MAQIKFIHIFFALLAIVALGSSTARADCDSASFTGPCFLWDNAQCGRVCVEEGRTGGHCSFPLARCLCEGC